MKKCLAFLVALLLLCCSTAIAEGGAYDEMTRDELITVIDQARAALAKLDMQGEIIYDENGITVSIDGKRVDNAGWLYFDLTIVNQSEYDISFTLSDTYINGWKVSDSETTVFDIAAGKNAKSHIRFINADDEASIASPDDVKDFEFIPIVKNAADRKALFTGEITNVLYE